MPEPLGPSEPSGQATTVRAVVGKAWRSFRPAPAPAPLPADPNAAKQVQRLRRQLDRARTSQLRAKQRLVRLAGAVVGDVDRVEEVGFGEGGLTFSDVRDEAKRARALAVLADLSAQGVARDVAQVATIRALLEVKETHVARALTMGLNADDDDMRRIGLALVLGKLKEEARAWELFALVPRSRLAELVPVEASEAGLASGTPEGSEAAGEIAQHPGHSADTLVRLAGQLLARGQVEIARKLGEQVDERLDELTAEDRRKFDALAYWLKPEPIQEPPAGAIRLGVLDYHQPDLERASKNLGDYVQTLAMLGNVARFRGCGSAAWTAWARSRRRCSNGSDRNSRSTRRSSRSTWCGSAVTSARATPFPRPRGWWPSVGTCIPSTASSTDCPTTPTSGRSTSPSTSTGRRPSMRQRLLT
ncbi:hypothetical protein [Nocardioides alcanivorans]|uniref:hypothetical protein n=1 Tax=Nocardioides alcanivorans TaxID=2897352 RepID=UPI001F237A7B|nr:hypothetical protein [Nocardioides alcanivorans]